MSERLRDGVVIGLFAVALVAWVFGPASLQLTSSFLGIEYVDHYGTQWFYWLAERSLVEGTSPLHTEMGKSLHPLALGKQRHRKYVGGGHRALAAPSVNSYFSQSPYLGLLSVFIPASSST